MHGSNSLRKVQRDVHDVGTLFTITLHEQAGMYSERSAGGSVWAAWETIITSSLSTPFIKISYLCIQQIKEF